MRRRGLHSSRLRRERSPPPRHILYCVLDGGTAGSIHRWVSRRDARASRLHIGTLLWPTERDGARKATDTNIDPPEPMPPDNVVAFADGKDVRSRARPVLTIIAIGLGIALTIASMFLVDPMETKRAIMTAAGMVGLDMGRPSN